MKYSHEGFLKLRGKALEIGVAATASSAFLLFGYDQGVMSGIITEPMFLEMFPKMDSSYKSGAIQSLVVAIYEIGCLLGSFIIIAFGDKLGRRRAVLIGCLIMLIGAAIQTSSFSLAQLIAGRIVTGAGNGMNTSSIPVWQSEMAPPSIRGFLVLFEGALITCGVMISYWINYGFFFVTQYDSFQWRFPIAFQCVFGIITIVGILAFPESPRWLLKHKKDEAAIKIMSDLYDTTEDDPQLQKDIKEIRRINEIESQGKLSFKEFFTNGRGMHGWRSCIAFLSQAFQQIGGINLVTYYATVVFEDSLGFSPALARLMTGALGTEYFLSALAAVFIVDRAGRRRLFLFGAVGMALSLMVAGVGLSQSESGKGPAGAYAATVMIFVYNTFFAIGWLGTSWLYPAEVTPIRIRAEANGFSTAANWLFNYAVVQLSPIMLNTISWKTFFVFMCINFAILPVVYFTFVETNGYMLERLDEIFAEAHTKKQNPVWVERRVRKGGKLDLDAEKEEELKTTDLGEDKSNDSSRGWQSCSLYGKYEAGGEESG